jgi:hypothetical protein
MLKFFAFFTFERLAILFFACVGLFFLTTFTAGFAWSWPFLILIVLLFMRYVFFGTVGAAGRKLQEQDFEGAQKMLSYTWKPEWLLLGMHGMYYFMQGTIDSQKRDLSAAEKNMLKALEIGLPDNDSTAMAQVNIAAMYLNKGRKVEAKQMLDKLKALKPSNPMITDAMKQLEQALNAPKVGIQHQQMMMRGKGGFRRMR